MKDSRKTQMVKKRESSRPIILLGALNMNSHTDSLAGVSAA
jgi:hypothetical protein